MTHAAAETDLRDWQLATLKELGEIGMALARELPAQAAAAREAEADRAAPDPVLAFSRISRAVRLTLALQTRILEGPKAQPERRPPPSRAAAPEDQDPLEDLRTTGRLRRAMTRFIAGTAIEACEREAAESEQLFTALEARLDREGDDDADFAEVEIKPLALAICRELGVDPGEDWWREAWDFDARDPSPGRGRMGPVRGGEREDGVTDPSGRSTAAPAPTAAPS